MYAASDEFDSATPEEYAVAVGYATPPGYPGPAVGYPSNGWVGYVPPGWDGYPEPVGS